MSSGVAPPSPRTLAQTLRARFVALQVARLPAVKDALLDDLVAQLDLPADAATSLQRRASLEAFRQHAQAWQAAVAAAWHGLLQGTPSAPEPHSAEVWTLVDESVVDTQIAADRWGGGLHDRCRAAIDDLQLRLRALGAPPEPERRDPWRPVNLVRCLFEAWRDLGQGTDFWTPLAPTLVAALEPGLAQGYAEANQALIAAGVLPRIELADRVRLLRAATPSRQSPRQPARSAPAPTSPTSPAPMASPGQNLAPQGTAAAPATPPPFWQQPASVRPAPPPALPASATAAFGGAAHAEPAELWSQVQHWIRPTDVGFSPPSPGLLTAFAAQMFPPIGAADGLELDGAPPDPVQAAAALRERSLALRQHASTRSEKATIEFVALMFQSILSEERIPSGVRVWIARLQMPVLRVALEDPAFLGNEQHPARALIDRMGSCVLGFEASSVQGATLEAEIRRIVQVVEQYPDTARQSFAVVLGEFRQFLDRFLTQSDSAQQVIGLAQQLERKEILTVQYTIELRKQLEGLPVHDAVREFLFKVWTEVLAQAQVRLGAHDPEMQQLRQAATDLVWTASAKARKAERSRVMLELPALLARLRKGMDLLGLASALQEQHLQGVSDALAEALLARTAAIEQSQIDALAERLALLEDAVGASSPDHWTLEPSDLELVLDADSDAVEVLPALPGEPGQDALSQARALERGCWWLLRRASSAIEVQYTWRSAQDHLHLFATASGALLLLTLETLARYLETRGLTPVEAEPLSLRATRDALSQIETIGIEG